MRISSFVIAAAVALTGCGSDSTPAVSAGVAPVAVEVGALDWAASAPTVVAVGTLGAKEEIPLAFKIGGVVARVNAEAGRSVRKGTVLAELAQNEIAAEVEKATQGHAKAQRDLARARALYRDSVATLEQLQDATTAFDITASNLRIAEFNRQYAVIRAPSDGVVLRRMAEPSQLVQAGSPIVFFRTNRRGLVVRAGLPDRDAVRIKPGDLATVRFDAYPGESFAGRVAEVSASATTGTGTYEVEVALDAPGRQLSSGLVGHIELTPRGGTRSPSVPVEALLEAQRDSATVYVVSPDARTAHRRRVLVGALDGNRVAIRGGLALEEKVVTAGAAWLTDGARVTVVPSADRKNK